MTEKNKQHERQPYVYEALGITEFRVDELMEFVREEVEAEHSITDSLEKFKDMPNISENERVFLLFTFGYYIYELDLMQTTLEAIEDMTDDLDSDMVTVIMGPGDVVEKFEGMEDFHKDIFRDVS